MKTFSIPFLPENNSHDDPFHNIVLPKPISDHSTHDINDHVPDNINAHQDIPKITELVNITYPIVPHDQNVTGLRRSTRTHRPPSSLKDFVCHIPHPITDVLSEEKLSTTYKEFVMNVSSVYEPQFYHQAAKIPKWRKAMSEEITALEANNTWLIQAFPKGKKTIECKWLYKTKSNADGSLD